jgi:hypothetical protein
MLAANKFRYEHVGGDLISNFHEIEAHRLVGGDLKSAALPGDVVALPGESVAT